MMTTKYYAKFGCGYEFGETDEAIITDKRIALDLDITSEEGKYRVYIKLYPKEGNKFSGDVKTANDGVLEDVFGTLYKVRNEEYIFIGIWQSSGSNYHFHIEFTRLII